VDLHGQYRALVNRVRRIAALIALVSGLWAGASAAQQAAGCRLALVLALDVSSSVDAREYELQRKGLAAALLSPDVRHAILHGAPGVVALAIYEWSGERQQQLHLDWTLLDSEARLLSVAQGIAGMERSFTEFPTSMGPALGYAARLLRRAPRCTRQVVDVSGDGVNNYRFGPHEAYRHFPFDGVTVNGLVILGDDPDVLDYYGREVLRGPGAFLEVAQGFEGFETAMRRKLTREIGDIVLGEAHPAQDAPG
jgi:hypothetical protein